MPRTRHFEYYALLDVIAWIDQHAITEPLPTDERSVLAQGCFDAVIEHQAGIAALYSRQHYSSMLALVARSGRSLRAGPMDSAVCNEDRDSKLQEGTNRQGL